MLTCPSWISVKDSLRSICFSNKGASLAWLPTILEKAFFLRFVSIEAASVGTAEEPLRLQGGITRVSKLHLSGSVHVQVPSVTWSSISFRECNELDIRQAKSITWLPTHAWCWYCGQCCIHVSHVLAVHRVQ